VEQAGNKIEGGFEKMELTVICCPTTGHRTHGDPEFVEKNCLLELNSHLGYIMANEGDFLELSDYFLHYDVFMNRLSKSEIGQKYKNKMFLILDGPGGSPKGYWGNAHPMAGTFNPTTLEKTRLPWAIEHDKNIETITGYGWNRNAVYLMTLLNWIWGGVHARGNKKKLEQYNDYLKITPQSPAMQRAVKELQEYLKATSRDGKKIDKLDRITILGWSRGAVTAIKIANALAGNGIFKSAHDILRHHPQYKNFTLFNNVPVCLFPMDPVAGPGNDLTRQNRTLPANVETCITPILLAEHKAGFKPQDKDLMQGPGVKNHFLYLTFPGLHESPSNIYFKGNDRFTWGTTAVGPLVYGLLHDVLRNKNEKLKALFSKEMGRTKEKVQFPPNYSLMEYIALYTHLVIHRPKYFAAKHFPKPEKFQDHLFGNQNNMYRVKVAYKKDRMIPKPEYVKYPFYFINEHHRLIFKKAMPKTYTLIETWAQGGKYEKKAMDEELDKKIASDLSFGTEDIKLLSHFLRLSIQECITEHFPHLYSWEKGTVIKNGIRILAKSSAVGKNNTLLANNALESEAWQMFSKGKTKKPSGNISKFLAKFFSPNFDPYLDYDRWMHDTYRFGVGRKSWRNIDGKLNTLCQAYDKAGKTPKAGLGSRLGPHYEALLKALNGRLKKGKGKSHRFEAGMRLKRALLRQAELTSYNWK
jgi:hypothetical protein